ncbi:hypothetical protein E2C01_076001 [Portunus trituberculatus]|uniref:Uncharacterized protein n=1 Tax=Portunus trituberculatus TaxID=210409 RepID=A0A5B7IIK7_PORTR|nr:hypothetical protein [Portunus trituberculatus]
MAIKSVPAASSGHPAGARRSGKAPEGRGWRGWVLAS